MLISHNREKLINAAIYFADNTQHCGKIKLIKLLYLLDFEHYRQTGIPVTGLEYRAMKMGPVPMALFEEWEALEPDFAEAIAIVLAVKGLGRYPELKNGNNSAVAERFIIGTFVSVLWACGCAGLTHWLIN